MENLNEHLIYGLLHPNNNGDTDYTTNIYPACYSATSADIEALFDPAIPPSPSSYRITCNISNGEGGGDQEIEEEGTATISITPNQNYSCPLDASEITVEGARMKSYTTANGSAQVEIEEPSSDVTVTAGCVDLNSQSKLYITATNCTVNSSRTYESTIYSGQRKNLSLGISSDAGYVLPDGGENLPEDWSCNNADMTYTKESSTEGIINISNVNGSNLDVVAKVKGVLSENLLTGKTWIPNRSLSSSNLETNSYNINFYFYSTTTGARADATSLNITNQTITYTTPTENFVAYNNGWQDLWSYIISITGGDDVSDPDLINFLNNNGILVDTITDMTGMTFNMLPAAQITPFTPTGGNYSTYALTSTVTCPGYSFHGTRIVFTQSYIYLAVNSSTREETVMYYPRVWERQVVEGNSTSGRVLVTTYYDPQITVTVESNNETYNAAKILRIINWFQANSYHNV